MDRFKGPLTRGKPPYSTHAKAVLTAADLTALIFSSRLGQRHSGVDRLRPPETRSAEAGVHHFVHGDESFLFSGTGIARAGHLSSDRHLLSLTY